jgi:hypothetical protein
VAFQERGVYSSYTPGYMPKEDVNPSKEKEYVTAVSAAGKIIKIINLILFVLLGAISLLSPFPFYLVSAIPIATYAVTFIYVHMRILERSAYALGLIVTLALNGIAIILMISAIRVALDSLARTIFGILLISYLANCIYLLMTWMLSKLFSHKKIVE